MGSYLGVEEVESGLEVLGDLLEGLFGIGDRGVCHLVIPGFGIRGSSSATHLVQGGHDLGSIGGVESGVQDKVGSHGLDPLGGIIVFAREISWEGHL